MSALDNRLYWIWLQQALGAGSPKADPLLRVMGSPARVWEADDAALRDVGFHAAERERLGRKSLEPAAAILKAALRDNGWVLTPDDALYPDALREIFALPLVLYGKGECPRVDERPTLAMVGTRKPTEYGRRMAWYLAAGVAAAGMTVVSGGAVGIDAAAHQGALDAGGVTIAVQACGLDVNYPDANAPLRQQILQQGGALISEYPPGTTVQRHTFQARNRLISGLAQATCIVEAPIPSGSLITATHAREQGRDVMALPGPAGLGAYAGSHALIQKGAYLVGSPADILHQYRDRFGDLLKPEEADKVPAPRWQPTQPQGQPPPRHAAQPPRREPRFKKHKEAPPATSPEVCTTCPEGASENGRRMFAVLQEQPRPVDWLAAKAELSPARAMAVLTELEILGGARCHAGQQYSR